MALGLMDKARLIRNFSRSACLYDQHADMQEKIGLELAGQIKKKDFLKILELGCGTGNYTLLLRNKFKASSIKAVDISDKMIDVAKEKLQGRGIEFVVGDAEDLILGSDFDLITSNACFQWFRALEKTLLRCKSILKKNGEIFFSTFGPRTFIELNLSLESVLDGNSIAVDEFMPKEKIKQILSRDFKAVKLREVKFKKSFVDVKDLLDKIKYTGTGGGGLERKMYFSRGLLKEIEKAYLEKFKEVVATYQVFFCQAKA